MKNQQNKNMGTKKLPLFTYFCLLLAVATMCTGATFARYVTSSNGGANVGVVPLVCSFSVDEVSSTAFNNSDYWMNIGTDEPQAQNTPREIIFSLHNYQKNGETKSSASEIDLQSTFRFFAPKELLGNIAFQILKKGAGNTRIPLTQQYVMPKIIQSVTGGQTSLSTADFKDGSGNPLDYGEYTGRPEETLALTNLAFDGDNGTGKFVAVAQANNVEIATLALTAETRENVSYEITQTRGTEYTIDGLSGNDMSAPEYYGVYKEEKMVYYCLDITIPSMTMVAEKLADGTFKYIDDQYVLAFTIINQYEIVADGTKQTGEHFEVKGVSLYNDSACTAFLKGAVIKVVNTFSGGTTTSEYYLVEGGTETEATLDTTAKTLTVGGTIYYVNDLTAANLNNYKWNPYAESETETFSYKLADIVRKVYQTDMRVLFTQASQTGE